MMRKSGVYALLMVLVVIGWSAPVLAQQKPPYWASVAAGEARMRTGPGRQFPASWLYQRAGLPVKVIEVYQDWRKVEDPDGTQGWMLATLLSGDRTGLVVGEIRVLREAPEASARIIWRAEPGVVGRLSDCARGWCKIDVRGRMGYIETSGLWGVSAAEAKR
jgi:SH3-like domain-containing protein